MTLTGDEAGARASLGERGRASFDVEVLFIQEADAGQTLSATYRTALHRV